MSALPMLWKPVLGTGAVLATMMTLFSLGVSAIGIGVQVPQERTLSGSFGAARIADYGAGSTTRFAPVIAELR